MNIILTKFIKNLTIILYKIIEEIVNYTVNKNEIIKKDIQAILRHHIQNNHLNTIAKDIWDESQRAFLFSREKGNRFYDSTHIIETLLPKGGIGRLNYMVKGEMLPGNIKPVLDLCNSTYENISIIGEGGIGKTTFLQHILESKFLDNKKDIVQYTSISEIPIFIELNQCSIHIKDWYQPDLKKTNFITRYIGALLENHSYLNNVSDETLIKVEKELQKSVNDTPQYLLLLDGFNEVTTQTLSNNKEINVRTLLSNEISVLSKYPNVRIITTSRYTESAYYMSLFKNITLIGLEDVDIASHLKTKKFSEAKIGQILANKTLKKCLRIPLFLCMFSAVYTNEDNLPETQGEILYCFFHKNGQNYNVKKRIQEINIINFTEKQIHFLIDFIIPYIGLYFESNNIFSISKKKMMDIIKESISISHKLFTCNDSNPFIEYEYDKTKLDNCISSFQNEDEILECIQDYLGIFYKIPMENNIKYGFIHHHFRDYFSAIYIVQILKMVILSPTEKFYLFNLYINHSYWTESRAMFISQVLGEHYNKAELNAKDNWYIPEIIYDGQDILTKCLDYCRILTRNHIKNDYFLTNILSAIFIGRGEYAGLDLSRLDLSKVNFFNKTCMKKGKSRDLITKFNESVLEKSCFEPFEHQNQVIEYLYHDYNCFTIDNDGIIKCWDVLSGKEIYSLYVEEPAGISDDSDSGFMKITNDGHYLIVKSQPSNPNSHLANLVIFDLYDKNRISKQFYPEKKAKHATTFSITEDMNYVLVLFDKKVLYCFHIEDFKIKYNYELDYVLNSTQLFSKSFNTPVYLYTNIFDPFNSYAFYDDYDEEEDFIDFDEHESDDIHNYTFIYVIDPYSGKEKKLYSFESSGDCPHAITYFHKLNCFLYYNNQTSQIELFNCNTLINEPVFEDITLENSDLPWAIHHNEINNDIGYIIYRSKVYVIDLNMNDHIEIIYDLESTLKHKFDSNYDDFYFYAPTQPGKDRFIIKDQMQTYEWDIMNDQIYKRYNFVDYHCLALVEDFDHNIFMTLHSYNGITIFDAISLKPKYAFCKPYDNYELTNYAYYKDNQQIALVYEKPGHSFIEVMKITDGFSKVIYSSYFNDFSICNIEFNNDGKKVLICTENIIYECEIDKENIIRIYNGQHNECFGEAHYKSLLFIEVAVVADSNSHNLNINPRVDILKYVNGIYIKDCYYLMPELKEKYFSKFIYQAMDFGIPAGKIDNGGSAYFVNNGFFIDKKIKIELKSYSYIDKTVSKYNVKPFDFIYMYHHKPIDTSFRTGKNIICYSCIDESFEKALIFKDYETIIIYSNLKENVIDKIFNYKDTDDFEGGALLWNSAILTPNNQLICNYQDYNLLTVNIDHLHKLKQINYNPGIAIQNCYFINIDADEITKEFINDNGGMVKDINNI